MPQKLTTFLSISLTATIAVSLGFALDATGQKRSAAWLNIPNQKLGSPARRRAAASRSGTSCPSTYQQISALIPEQYPAQTISAYPTFWFYFPQLSSSAGIPTQTHSEFELQSQDHASILRIPLELPKTSGITSFLLPSLPKYALEPGKTYRWYLTINCDPQDRTKYLFLAGEIQRVSLPSSAEDYTTYIERGIWHDALTTLANQYSKSPNTFKLREDWVKLLHMADLDDLAQAPILSPSTDVISPTANLKPISY
jgi:Domain of Unknown Function (DUF928)